MDIPPELRDADTTYQRILAEVPFPRFMNPLNGPEARRRFFAGAEAPPFAYATAELDDVVDTLGRVVVPQSHPFGPLVSRAIEGLILLCRALMDRGPELFDRLNAEADWYPRPEDVLDTVTDPDPAPDQAMIPAEEMLQVLSRALRHFGLGNWQIELDPVMSSRILVESSKQLVHVNPVARFRRADLRGMVAHEIGVHVLRGAGGRAQPISLFATGLPGAGPTEEGLAILAEERVGALPEAFERRQIYLQRAVLHARDAGFREVYDRLTADLGPAGAYGVCARIKRGLGDPAGRGVYAKDTVYLRGYREVGAWLRGGGNLAWLYTGKVGIHDPIGAWIEAGLVQPAEPPGFWAAEDPGAAIDGTSLPH